jgi:uncharacterized protein
VNRDSPFHQQAKAFIESCAGKGETWYVCLPVIHAFLRISTHPGIMPSPLTPKEAVAIIDGILQLPQVRKIGDEGPNFWDIYKKEITTEHLRGNRITDAVIYSVMKAHGVRTIYTKDRDFLMFKGINAIDPLVESK